MRSKQSRGPDHLGAGLQASDPPPEVIVAPPNLRFRHLSNSRLHAPCRSLPVGAAKSPSTVINALKNITDPVPWGNSRNVNRAIRACAGLDISRNPIRAPANLPERTGSRGRLLKNLLKVVRIISQSFGVQFLLRMLSVRHVVAGPDGHRRRLVS